MSSMLKIIWVAPEYSSALVMSPAQTLVIPLPAGDTKYWLVHEREPERTLGYVLAYTLHVSGTEEPLPEDPFSDWQRLLNYLRDRRSAVPNRLLDRRGDIPNAPYESILTPMRA